MKRKQQFKFAYVNVKRRQSRARSRETLHLHNRNVVFEQKLNEGGQCGRTDRVFLGTNNGQDKVFSVSIWSERQRLVSVNTLY